MSQPRQVLRGTTYLLTRRCMQRQFLLRPCYRTNGILRYCLMRAAERYGVLVHAYCFMSNHYHLVVTDPHGVLPEFMRYLNEFTARQLNVFRGRREALWSSDGYKAVELLDREAIVDKVVYTLANPVAAGLVARGERWPGLWSHPRLIDGPAESVTRPDVFFKANGSTPEVASVALVRPPGFASTAEFVDAVREKLRKAENEAADAHRGPDGLPRFLGVAAVLRQKPTDSPSSVEERSRIIPRFASKDRGNRLAAINRWKRFLENYREAWRAFCAGIASVFPTGTYLLRVRFGVTCAPT